MEKNNVEKCSACTESIKNNLIYEDTFAFAVVANEAGNGHVKVYSAKHYGSIEEMPDNEASHLFFVASYAATAVFEAIGAQGTNIILNNLQGNHVCLDVIPRTNEDDLDFKWRPVKLDQQTMEEVMAKLRDETPKQQPTPQIKQPPKMSNYMIKRLKRTP